uniref:Candidate secreted effector n=1 Tax=Meloidogyne incognita TaxID=6306 RepID=A0A914LHN2_MELIC
MEESIDKRHEQLSSKDVNALIDSEKIQKSGRKRRARESSTSSSSSSGSSSSGSSGSSTGSSSSEEEEGEIKFNNPSSSIGSLQQNVEKRQLSNTEKR